MKKEEDFRTLQKNVFMASLEKAMLAMDLGKRLTSTMSEEIMKHEANSHTAYKN